MPTGIIQTLRDKSIIFSAALVLLLVIANIAIMIYYNRAMERAKVIQLEADEIISHTNVIWSEGIKNLDLGIRAYGIIQDEKFLAPYNGGMALYEEFQPKLKALLEKNNYPNMKGYGEYKKALDVFVNEIRNMRQLIDEGNYDKFLEEFERDPGSDLWHASNKHSGDIRTFAKELTEEATEKYNLAIKLMVIILILLGIIGVPTLVFMIIRIVRDERSRKKLFKELEQNNRQYLFDPGTEFIFQDERQVINNSILNFQKAASFINQISKGNLKVDWEELNDQNRALNQTNLAGELIQMKEKMKEIKAEDHKRMWITEGLAKFSDIIRTYQHDLKVLGDQSVAFIVKYLEAQQGSVYILREDEDEEETYLELISCYAFNKKKHLEKKIEIGQGLVGQTYLEKLPVMLTDVPNGYTEITSGLGEATPDCLLIVPMTYNEKVEAVVEIASFIKYEEYQLEWIQKIGEIMASTLISLKNSEKTNFLLEQFKQQTEQLKAQEEELRQNMEEMEATQEEMQRKEKELELRQQELQKALGNK